MRPALLVIATLSTLMLASCSPAQNKQASVEKPSTKTEETKQSGFSGMKNVITNTKTAIGAANFEKAKTDFAKFEDSWKTVEDSVKKTAPTQYSAIEEGMEAINKGIKEKNKNSTMAALDSLSKNVASLDK